ncbi:MAG: flagellum-specific ATP synthase FliI, partial [Planctomycetota bacterium]|nr:flagellum-specific ATP synthase FliI [Planctomycetota bacterium]
MEIFQKYHDVLTRTEPLRRYGRVREIIGLVAQCEGLSVPLGAQCEIQSGDHAVLCEVIGFRGEHSLLMAYESLEGVRLGDPV